MQAELKRLTKALDKPERPLAAMVGGAKVSTKLELLGNLMRQVDSVIGGGMANTFLSAKGKEVGSRSARRLADTARDPRRRRGALPDRAADDAVDRRSSRPCASTRTSMSITSATTR